MTRTVIRAPRELHGMSARELRAALQDVPDDAYPRFRLTASWHNDGGRALEVTIETPAT
ncbi:hypothetical protein [Cryptosporangium sp. NPDC051539]|uniref:hypothetical protein n=1 Tax=Cryptosporangium sp. NPDC051539 TaxID=3363962 RepID=UPI0037942BBE